MANIGIAGAARVEGTTRTAGKEFAIVREEAHPAVKRAVVFWFGAVALLFVFHVGGAQVG